MSTDYLKTDFRLPKNSAHGQLQGSLRLPAYRTISYRTVATLAMICDALLIFSTSVLSGAIYNFAINGLIGDVTIHVGFAAVVAALFIALGKIHEIYTLSALLHFKSQIRTVAITWTLVFLFSHSYRLRNESGRKFLTRYSTLFCYFRPCGFDCRPRRLADFSR